MRAYRQADVAGGVQILTATEFAAITTANRSSNVLYVVGTQNDQTTGATTRVQRTINISDVWIGNTAQSFLVDNTNALVWASSSAISSGAPDASAVPVENLV